jgi:hypothetical protein
MDLLVDNLLVSVVVILGLVWVWENMEVNENRLNLCGLYSSHALEKNVRTFWS